MSRKKSFVLRNPWIDNPPKLGINLIFNKKRKEFGGNFYSFLRSIKMVAVKPIAIATIIANPNPMK